MDAFTTISLYSFVPPLLLAVWKKAWNPYPFIFSLIILKMLGEFLGLVSWYVIPGMNNLFGYHIIAVCEMAFVGGFFYRSPLVRQFSRIPYFLTVIVFLAFSVTNVLLWQSLKEYNSYGKALLSIAVTVLCLAWFRGMLTDSKEYHIERSPSFWFVNYFFIFYSAAFVSQLFINWLSVNVGEELASRGFDIFVMLNLLGNLVLTWALWLIPPPSSSSSSRPPH